MCMCVTSHTDKKKKEKRKKAPGSQQLRLQVLTLSASCSAPSSLRLDAWEPDTAIRPFPGLGAFVPSLTSLVSDFLCTTGPPGGQSPADRGKALDFLCQRPSNVNKHVNKLLFPRSPPQPLLQPTKHSRGENSQQSWFSQTHGNLSYFKSPSQRPRVIPPQARRSHLLSAHWLPGPCHLPSINEGENKQR